MLCHGHWHHMQKHTRPCMLRFLLLLLPLMCEHHCVEERGENIAVVTAPHGLSRNNHLEKKIQVKLIVKCEVALGPEESEQYYTLIR
jgi:hypothetical protein